ncbi:MAG: DUF5906 domain-containing protein [Melioribacteraceae bacterium]|nr:DUF5906 domain-containing protein [Melioribacteraceae bacterium]
MKTTEGTLHEKSISISYNPTITKDDKKRDVAKFTEGWELTQLEWDKEILTEFVRSQSYICAKLKDGYRNKYNVEEVFHIVLDIDNKDRQNPITLDAFIKIARKWKFSWFLHTTTSHQKKIITDKGEELEPVDKFRVLIPLSKTVTRDFLVNEVKNHFVKHYSFIDDKSSFEGERYYFVSKNAETEIHSFVGSTGGLVFFNPDNIDKVASASSINKKSKTFNLDLSVTLGDGKTTKKISDINEKTTIFCPFCIHDDAHRSSPDAHNAFIDINPLGHYYIYCSSEAKTYWQSGQEIKPEKTKLFWNTTEGCVTAIDYKTKKDPHTIYSFKNNTDFRNYCHANQIDPNITERLPRREIIFDPRERSGLAEIFYNVFEESEYLVKYGKEFQIKISLQSVNDELEKRCPVISELLSNIFGSPDYVMRFINWNAYILQTRGKAFTAWLVSTPEQGIGKDFMFNFILRPIYGQSQSQLLNGQRIADKFNIRDLRCWLRGYNEVFSSESKQQNHSRKEKLKDNITSVEQTLEPKGIDTFQADNFVNFILFSNNSMPIYLDAKDRRFNVIVNHEAKKVKDLSFYKDDNELVKSVKSELDGFAEILFSLDYSAELANQSIDNEAKRKLIKITANDYEKFTEALKNRDADYFMLDEVFRVADSQRFLIDKSVYAIEAEDKISNHGMIPANCMNDIVRFHFPQRGYKLTLEKLKTHNLAVKTFNIGGARLKGWYCVE